MPNHPAKRLRGPVREADRSAAELVEPSSGSSVFVSFSYSRTEITAHGGKARLRTRSTRFEDGKLTSESFEGELDRSTYDQLVKTTQQHVAGQTAQFLRSLSLFLPF